MHLGKAEREIKAAVTASVSDGDGGRPDAPASCLSVRSLCNMLCTLCEPHKLDGDFSEVEHMSIVWLAFLGHPELSSPLLSPTITITICQEQFLVGPDTRPNPHFKKDKERFV